MKLNHHKITSPNGFAALIAVLLLASTTLAIALVALSASVMYLDSVNAKEWRIQAHMNVESCLESATLMVAKDFYIQGTSTLLEFGCNLTASNDYIGHIHIYAQTDFVGTRAWGSENISVVGNAISVVSKDIF